MQTNSARAIVWSQERCTACNSAKALLSSKNITYQERIIGMDEGNWTKQALLAAVPDARSVPQIFLDGNYIGGFPELKKYLDDNTQNA